MLSPEEKAYRWKDFCEYAEKNGISIEDLEDYEMWWDCWKTAIKGSSSIDIEAHLKVGK